MVVVALDQYALGAIVVSVFALVVAIYSFVAAKKKVAGELRTDDDVIIVSAGVAGSPLAHPLGKVRQNFLSFLSRQPNSALNISFSIFLNFELQKYLLKFRDIKVRLKIKVTSQFFCS